MKHIFFRYIINICIVLGLLNTNMAVTQRSILPHIDASILEHEDQYLEYEWFPSLCSSIVEIVKAAQDDQTEETLLPPLWQCYEAIQNDKKVLPVKALFEAMPIIIAYLHKKELRAPRPDAQGIVSPGTCDLSEVIALLHALEQQLIICCNNTSVVGTCTLIVDIESTLTTCCAAIQNNFNGTFTVLNELVTSNTCACRAVELLVDIESTLTTCCENMTLNFEGTFTTLNAISDLITVDFNSTFTVLESLLNTTTTCCAAIQNNFNGTFTVLNELLTSDTCACRAVQLLNAELCTPILIDQNYYNTLPNPKVLGSGTYIVTEDIVYTPAAGAAAFILTGSDILLDLKCSTISPANSTTLGVDGIRVTSNNNDVTIRNGIIRDFTGNGIQVDGPSNRLMLQDITIVDVGLNGIGCQSSSSILDNGSIQNVDLYQTSTNTGTVSNSLSLQNCRSFIVKEARIAESGAATNTYSAVNINNGQANTLHDIQIVNNSAGSFNGLSINSSSASNQCYKLLIAENRGTALAGQCNGVLINSSSSNNIADCAVLLNTGTLLVAGFNIINSTNNTIVNGQVTSNSVTGSAGTLYGYTLSGGSYNTLINGIVTHNTAANSTVQFSTIGYELNTTTSQNLFKCIASDNVATTTSIGFDITNGGGNEIKECESIRHTIGYRISPSNNENNALLKNAAVKNIEGYNQFPIGSFQSSSGISGINANLTSPWTNISLG